MDSTRYEPECGSISSSGQVELLQHSNSATESTVSTTLTRDDSTEIIAGGASTTPLVAPQHKEDQQRFADQGSVKSVDNLVQPKPTRSH